MRAGRKEGRTTTQETIAANIRSVIRQKGLIQRVVAERAGFSEQQFCGMLAGRKIMRAEFMPAIAKALGMTPNDLFKDAQGTA